MILEVFSNLNDSTIFGSMAI